MKYLSLAVLFVLFSCGNKEDILLPKAAVTVVGDVQDHSPIYMFFRTKEKDTLVEVNKKNEIISTNWIFNIDKRLPLHVVLPEIIKLQEKKRNEKAHKNEAAQNYYSYADSIGKNLAFLPFTNVHYELEKPRFGVIVFFTKSNDILVNSIAVKREELQNYLSKIPSDKPNKYLFCFSKELSFDNYITDEIYIQKIKASILEKNSNNQEFIF